MANSKKTEKVGKNTYRETKTYPGGDQTRTVYKPRWFGREVISREYRKPRR